MGDQSVTNESMWDDRHGSVVDEVPARQAVPGQVYAVDGIGLAVCVAMPGGWRAFMALTIRRAVPAVFTPRPGSMCRRPPVEAEQAWELARTVLINADFGAS